MLKNMKFETSVFSIDKIIDTDKKQIILVGKSNVGKSSFINSLANQKALAKVGQTPGKTKCLNYYSVDNKFYIVDLPGYGYSTMTQSEKQNTSKLINYYIEKNDNICHIFMLVDIRHKPTNDDRMMYDWLASRNIPFTIVATKADKITSSKQSENILQITKFLFSKESILPFSSQTKLNLSNIEDIIYKSQE